MGIVDKLDDASLIVKSRSHAGDELWCHRYGESHDGKVSVNEISGGSAFGWHQYTESRNNAIYFRARRSSGGLLFSKNIGGPFFTRRFTLEYLGDYPHRRYLARWGNVPYTPIRALYDGIVFPSSAAAGMAKAIHQGEFAKHTTWVNSPHRMSREDLRVIGERIMLGLVPTKPAVEALVSLGELVTEGKLFGVPGGGLSKQDPGGEFLNYQFGISPVLSDARSFNEGIKEYDKILAQYKRDAGKRIRRRTERKLVEDSEDTTVRTTAYPIGADGGSFPPYCISASGKSLTTTTKIKRYVWYSGAFEYHIPEEISRLAELVLEWNRVYGIIPDPARMWELLPFSWLIDWFTNSGNFLRHMFLQTSEGATQTYGYVMCETHVETTWTYKGQFRVDGVLQPDTITMRSTDVLRQRERVIPFGPSATGKELTARQLAILGALAIAH